MALVHKFQLSTVAGLYHPNQPRNQLLRHFNSTTGTRRFEACGAPELLTISICEQVRNTPNCSLVQQGNKYETLSWAVFSACEPIPDPAESRVVSK